MSFVMAGMGAGVAGGLIGQLASQGDENQAQAAQQAALQGILNVNTPTISEEQVTPTTESVVGTLNPNMQSTAQIGSNAMAGISTDPRLQQAQMQALSQLQQQGQSGFTSAQLAALQGANQQAAGQAQSANAAVMQNMAARGMGGSGMELAAKLSNSQNAANLSNTQGNQLAGQAQQNALAATAASGQLGGQMQQTQFGQQSQIAAAQNAINQFNTANQQNVIGQNTTAQNAAQSANLANAQNVANTNTGLQNQAQYYNKGLYQQQYQDQLAQASAAAGQQNNLSTLYQNQAKNTAGAFAGAGAGIGTAATALGNQNATNNLADAIAGMFKGGQVKGYADGGQVSEDINDYMPSKEEEENSGYPPGPQRAAYIANKKMQSAQATSGQTPPTSYSNGGLADPEIGYDEGGDIKANLAALQRGANATTDAVARARGQGTGTPFDPTKYGRPDYTNAEDAAQNGQDEAAASDAGKAYAKYRADNGLDASGYAMGGQINLHPQSAPSDNYGQMGMADGGQVNVNDDDTDTTKMVPAQGSGMSHPSDSDLDAMSPEELDVQMKKLKYVMAKKKMANGGQVESADTSQKTLGATIGYPGSQPSPQPSPEPKNFKAGGSVPGKAKVPGDSPRNDTVHAKLSPGELVIPRSIVGAGDEAIMDFVKHVMKKNERK